MMPSADSIITHALPDKEIILVGLNRGYSLGEKIPLKNKAGAEMLLKALPTASIPAGVFAVHPFIKWFLAQETVHKITLGCDPEFALVARDGKTVVSASRFLRYSERLGSDGPLAEVRPNAAETVVQVVENIKELLLQLPKKINAVARGDLIPEAHSEINNYALGFHVHLGLPKIVLGHAAPNATEFIRGLVNCLDYFVGLPAAALDNDERRRLGNGKYGKLHDYRLSERTLEYRTPGGFHLRHPDYAGAILALSLCLTEDYSDRFATTSKGNLLNEVNTFYRLPSGTVLQNAFKQPGRGIILRETIGALQRLRDLPNYIKYASAIEPPFWLLLQGKQHNPQILPNWG